MSDTKPLPTFEGIPKCKKIPCKSVLTAKSKAQEAKGVAENACETAKKAENKADANAKFISQIKVYLVVLPFLGTIGGHGLKEVGFQTPSFFGAVDFLSRRVLELFLALLQ